MFKRLRLLCTTEVSSYLSVNNNLPFHKGCEDKEKCLQKPLTEGITRTPYLEGREERLT